MNRYAYTRNNPIIYVDPSGHGFFSKFFKIAIPILIGIAVFAAFPGSAALGTGFFAGAAGGVSAGAVALAGGVAGFAGGFAGGLMSGGGLKAALIGGGIGFVAGLAGGGVSAQFARPLAAAVAGGAAGGGAGGFLAAAMSGQNVFEGAIIGAGTGAAFAAASYGAVRAVKGANPKVAGSSGTSGSGPNDPLGTTPASNLTPEEQVRFGIKQAEEFLEDNFPELQNFIKGTQSGTQKAGQVFIAKDKTNLANFRLGGLDPNVPPGVDATTGPIPKGGDVFLVHTDGRILSNRDLPIPQSQNGSIISFDKGNFILLNRNGAFNLGPARNFMIRNYNQIQVVREQRFFRP